MSSELRYEVTTYWSEEDEALIAEVPELRGCAADGKEYEQALANVQFLIEEWIETAKELYGLRRSNWRAWILPEAAARSPTCDQRWCAAYARLGPRSSI